MLLSSNRLRATATTFSIPGRTQYQNQIGKGSRAILQVLD